MAHTPFPMPCELPHTLSKSVMLRHNTCLSFTNTNQAQTPLQHTGLHTATCCVHESLSATGPQKRCHKSNDMCGPTAGFTSTHGWSHQQGQVLTHTLWPKCAQGPYRVDTECHADGQVAAKQVHQGQVHTTSLVLCGHCCSNAHV